MPSGLTRSEIRNLFHRNRSAAAIEEALSVLTSGRLARCEKEVTGGRPTERWFAIEHQTTTTASMVTKSVTVGTNAAS